MDKVINPLLIIKVINIDTSYGLFFPDGIGNVLIYEYWMAEINSPMIYNMQNKYKVDRPTVKKDVIVFNYYTHIFLGLLVGYGIDYVFWDFSVIEMVLYYLFLIIGSLILDIDTPKSLIGSKFKKLSTFIYNVFGHRGIIHKLAFVNIIFLLSVIFYGVNIINIAMLIGCIMHILGDKISSKYSYILK